MHEAGIMQDTLDRSVREAVKSGATRIESIRMRVGVLSGVVPEALQFAFDALTPGTLVAGGRLEIEPVAARFYCIDCALEYSGKDLVEPCSACGGVHTRLLRGLELELVSVEVS